MNSKPTYQELEKEVESLREALKNNKDVDFFRLLTENSTEGISVVNSEGIPTYRSPSSEEINGFTIEDMVGKDFSKHIFKDDLENLQSKLKEILNKPGEPIKMSYRGYHKNGQLLHIESTAKNMFHTPIKGIIATYRDVTEKVLAKKELINSKDFFRLLTENNTEGMSVINSDGVLIYRNPSSKNINGFTFEDMVGKNTFDYVHEDDIQMLKNQLAKALEKPGNIVNVSYRGYHKNGKLLYYEGTIKNMLHSPIINGFIINYRDVTNRIKAEKALSDSEKKYKNIIENLIDSYYRANANGIVTLASPSCMRMFGYSKMDEVIGGKVETLYPNPKTRKEFLDLLLKNGKVKSFRTKLHKKNGEEMFVETSANILIDDDGNFNGVEGIVRDITDRKIIAEALKKSESELKKIIKTKDKFFSIIAHDLKSPFNAIIGFSNLLNVNFDNFNAKQQKEFIKLIKESSENAYKLLENLLTWSRSQQGTINFVPQNKNLYLLSFATTELLKQSFRNKSIKLNNKISDNINVFVDENMVLTVLRNLISNAIKFTKKGGEVSLFSKIISNKNKKQFVEITIKDTGVGISPNIVNKIFSLSESASTKGTENESGTGLGLIICKEFIKKQGGTIRVESEEGKGSSFIFTLPLSS